MFKKIKRYFTVLLIWLILEYDKNRLWLNNFTDNDEVEIQKPKIVIAFQLAESFMKEYNKYLDIYDRN